MAVDLVLPSGVKPSNLTLAEGVSARVLIDPDMFDICSRVKEISPDIEIVQLTRGDKDAYAVMENCSDGVLRLIKKVQELDGRLLADLRKMYSVPLQERIKLLEAENVKYERDQREYEAEKLYENMGAPMRRELERTGFIEHRGVSYPTAAVATGGRRRR